MKKRALLLKTGRSCGFLRARPWLVFVGLAAVWVWAGLLGGCYDSPYQQGRDAYFDYCANCHMENGTGLEQLIPPLRGADYVRDSVHRLPCIIRHGMTGKIVVNGVEYEGEMPGVKELTDFEITNLINYINTAWGNDFPTVTYDMVKKELEKCP